MKKIRPFFGIAARAGLVAAVFVGLFLFPAQAHADRTITSVTLNGASSVTVAPGATIAAAVNVTTDGSGSNARWRSTGWSISATAPGAVTCVDHPNHDGAGAYSETFSITAPTTSGTYNAYFIGYNNDSCSSGASATRTMTNAVIVTGAAPPTATTNAASAVTPYVATLNGTVSSNGASTAVSFEYGLTTSYGYSTTPSTSLADDAVNAAVSDDLFGLNCNTTFHYRVKATNSAGTAYGADQTFTTGACTAPFPATACAATRFNGDLGCTANDVNITDITLAPTGQQSSCVSGTPVTLDLDMTVNFSSPDRWDVGIFIANDGKLPTLLPANGGASSCSVAVLPIIPETGSYTFPDLDGLPQGTADTCGDGSGAINGGTGSGVKRMTGVTIPCYATPDSGGKLFVPFVVSWDNQKSPIGGICTSNQYPVPNTTSKCNAPLSSVPI
ncbi:MAG: hypothetical protein Q8O58_02950, partial [Gallionella sp.]|nr:hypothetical protein [Gallionella sp.]